MKPGTEEGRAARRLVPPRAVLRACFILAVLVVTARATTLIGDQAIVNVATLVLTFLGCVVVGWWFMFHSGYGKAFRVAAGLATLCGLGYFAASYTIDHVSGDLIPTFRARGAMAPDELLDVPVTESVASLSLLGPDDFPRFLGPDGTGRLATRSFSADWETRPPRQLWRKPIGAGWSSFVAANGYAFTMEQRGDDELTTCYEVGSGRLVWTHGVSTRHETVLGGVGPRSTPTIHAGKVYSVGATGHVACLDGATGDVIWSDNLLDRLNLSVEDDLANLGWGRSGSPLIVDDLVVLPAGGPATGPPRSLIAYDKETGSVAWMGGDQQIAFNSPILTTIVGTSQIVTVNEESITAHDPSNGDLLWSHPWPGKNTAEPNTSQPVKLGDDRLFFSKGYRGGAMVLKVERGEDGRFHAEEVWRDRRVMKTKFTNVVERGGYIYGLSDGILECIEAATGSRQWKRGRYYHGQLLGVDDLLLVQAEKGDVVLVDASPEGQHERGSFSALTGDTANNPCLHGRLLLVRNSREAACYELPAREGE